MPALVLVLIPRLFTDPSEPDAGICSNFDGGGLCSCDGLFHALHEVLRIPHQHIRGFQVLLCSLNMKRKENSVLTFNHVFLYSYQLVPVLRIRRIRMILGLLDPYQDPLVRGMDTDPAPDPDPSIIKQEK